MPRTRQPIVGKQFGHWKVMSEVGGLPRMVAAMCVCGHEQTIYAGNLLSGKSRSCGCRKAEHVAEARRIPADEILGQRYSRLIVIRETSKPSGKRCFECKCDCGKIVVVKFERLQSGHTQSCGCLARESRDQTRHGDKTKYNVAPEYNTWIGMIGRCENSNNHKFDDYGGRGIMVCERWRERYENFLEDMGRRPSPEHSIDRVNVNGNYEPVNCRWATAKEQANNRRRRNIKKL